MNDRLHLSHRAMIGWPRLKPSQQKTSCPYDFTPDTDYYVGRRGQIEMSLAVLFAFDCHRRAKNFKSFTKQKVIFEIAPHTVVIQLVSETKTGANESANVCFNTVETLLYEHWSSFKTRMTASTAFLAVIWMRGFTRL